MFWDTTLVPSVRIVTLNDALADGCSCELGDLRNRLHERKLVVEASYDSAASPSMLCHFHRPFYS